MGHPGDVIRTSGTSAALLHDIGAAKYESGKVIKARFAGISSNKMCLYWNSYFYTNVYWPNLKHGRVITWSHEAHMSNSSGISRACHWKCVTLLWVWLDSHKRLLILVWSHEDHTPSFSVIGSCQ